jgi:hypothetical protein
VNQYDLRMTQSVWGNGVMMGTDPIGDYSMLARSRRITAMLAHGAMAGANMGMPPIPGMSGFNPASFGMPVGQTGVITVDEQLQQSVYNSIMSGAILTLSQLLLYGTGIVVTNFKPRYSQSEAGTTVKVPYFDVMPAVQTIAVDGDAGQPVKVESSEEQNTVVHGYLGRAQTEMTELFSPFGGQIQSEFSSQARVRFAEWADLLLVTEAMNKAVAADVPVTNPRYKRFKTVYSATVASRFRRQLFIDSLQQRGAFGFSNLPKIIIVHTDVIADMLSVNDAIGNMNLVSGAEQMANRDLTMATTQASPTGLMLMPFNVPIAVTGHAAFKPAVTGSDLPKYRSLMLWQNALGWMQNPIVELLTQGNIHIPTKETAMHTYAVAHAYKRADMNPLPGFFCIEHN